MDQISLKKRFHKGRPYPVVHLLTGEGRADTFAPTVAVPEAPNDGPEVGQIFAVTLLVTEDGTMCVDADGTPIALKWLADPEADVQVPLSALVPLNVTQLLWAPQPETLLSYKQVAALAKCSLATVKRAVASGQLASPVKTGKRSVRFTVAAAEAWMNGVVTHGAATFKG